jgi:hypothetical protein
MVGMYSGESDPDEHCPNCGRQVTAAHLMLCPDKDRTRLLLENVDELVKWMEKDEKTDPELAYWIPKYILMGGDKPFSALGRMSPKLLSLANSQDRIGWRNFTEGHISIHFYEIQKIHLAMSSSFLKNNSSQRYCKSLTHSGSIVISCCITSIRDISTIKERNIY